MRHEITIAGPLYRLRPVRIEDASFIVGLRTGQESRRFIHHTDSDVRQQEHWIKRYFEQPNDYYFIVESIETAKPEGTVAIYDFDPDTGMAEWGRWVISPGSSAGIPSMILAFQLAFGKIGVVTLCSHTAVQNGKVIAILERFGMRETRRISKYIRIRDDLYDAVRHEITRAEWLLRSQPVTAL